MSTVIIGIGCALLGAFVGSFITFMAMVIVLAAGLIERTSNAKLGEDDGIKG